MSIINQLFSKKKQTVLSKIDARIDPEFEKIKKYYSDFEQKVVIFSQLKESIISLKSAFNSHPDLTLSSAIQTQQWLKEANRILNEIDAEISRITTLISYEKDDVNNSIKFSMPLLTLLKEDSFKDSSFAREVMQLLEGKGKQKDGLFYLLANQLQLIHDLRESRKELLHEFKGLKSKSNSLNKAQNLMRIIELEILRLGTYIHKENELVSPNITIGVLKKFMQDYNALRSVGLVYSERQITPYNIGIITIKFAAGLYGVKGIGIIHENGKVDLRFVKGKNERHAEVVRMLEKGIPGTKLADDVAVRGYLFSLPLTTLNKIAGYELQLQFDKNDELKIVNIDYNSTILEVQISRGIERAEFVQIKKVDFERLNYTLLFSINKNLINTEEFAQNIERKGTKIIVRDERIMNFIKS